MVGSRQRHVGIAKMKRAKKGEGDQDGDQQLPARRLCHCRLGESAQELARQHGCHYREMFARPDPLIDF
jgi:hypothetical protein